MLLVVLGLPLAMGSCAAINFAGTTPTKDVFGFEKFTPPEIHSSRSVSHWELVAETVTFFTTSRHGAATLGVALVVALPFWRLNRRLALREGIDIFAWYRGRTRARLLWPRTERLRDREVGRRRDDHMLQPWASISLALTIAAGVLWALS